MAPKAADDLIGQQVVAPRSLWPTYPLPKGATGFDGKVGKRKDKDNHYVTFPGDSSKYFFPDSEIRQWLGRSAAPVSTALTPKRKAEAAPAAASSGGRTAAASSGPSSKKPKTGATVKEPPSGKAPAKSAAVARSSGIAEEQPKTKSQLRQAINSALDLLPDHAHEDVYKFVLNLKNKLLS